MPPPSVHDPLAEGLGWRELELAPADDDDRWPMRPPLVTWRETELPSLAPEVWEAAVAKAQGVYRRTGVRSGTAEAPHWAAVRGRRRIHLEADRFGASGRLRVEHVRPEPRPWLMATSLLCWPTALVGVVVLLARPAAALDWAVVGGLMAIPVAVGALIAVREWAEALAARWQAGRVLRAARKASRTAKTVWVPASEIEDLEQIEPAEEPGLLPMHVAPGQWLSTEEMEDLDGAEPEPEADDPTLVWPVETLPQEPAPTLVWPVEVAGGPALKDVPFAETWLERARDAPRGDGVSAAERLPELEAIHLHALAPSAGDAAAPPFTEWAPIGAASPAAPAWVEGAPAVVEEALPMASLRRSPEPAAPRPPEPRAARVVPFRMPPETSDVFTEWHPRPPWAWE